MLLETWEGQVLTLCELPATTGVDGWHFRGEFLWNPSSPASAVLQSIRYFICLECSAKYLKWKSFIFYCSEFWWVLFSKDIFVAVVGNSDFICVKMPSGFCSEFFPSAGNCEILNFIWNMCTGFSEAFRGRCGLTWNFSHFLSND